MVPLIQFSLLKSQLEFGFAPDDVAYLSDFNLLGDHPYRKLEQIWISHGVHSTSAVYYMGSLSKIFGFHYESYYLLAQIFKILTALSLFYLVLIITKKLKIAFLSSIIYSMHYSSVGSLEMVVRSNDYLASFAMVSFLTLYYFCIEKRKQSLKWLLPISLILLVSIVINPIRTVPLLVLISLVEGYFLIKSVKFHGLGERLQFDGVSLKRLLVLFAPYILLFLHSPRLLVYPISPSVWITRDGNWQLLINPLASIGSMFFMENKLWIFGSEISDLSSYMIHFFGVTLFFVPIFLIISKNPKKFLKNFLLLCIFSNLLIYIILVHYQSIDLQKKIYFDLYPVVPLILWGNFIMISTVCLFKEWITNKQDRILFMIWMSMFFSLIFILVTWIFQDYKAAIGIIGYLTLPSIGISTFIAVVIFRVYTRLRMKFKGVLSIFPVTALLLLILIFYIESKLLIDKYIRSSLVNGMRASDQRIIVNNLKQPLSKFNYKTRSVFYITADTGDTYYSFYNNTIRGGNFPYWMQVYFPLINNNCLLPLEVYKLEDLSKTKTIRDGQKGFLFKEGFFSYQCGMEFFSVDNFYAFKLKNKEIYDIKPEILQQLGME